MDFNEQRHRHILRFLIDNRELFLMFLGVAGIFLLPIYVYPMTDFLIPYTNFLEQLGFKYTFIILIIQIGWIVLNFFLIAHFLQAERYRKRKNTSI